MSTIGWLLVLVGALAMRSVSKGRSITDIPTDLGDALSAIITNDQAKLRAVLNRTTDISLDMTGTTADQAPAAPTPTTATHTGAHTQAELIALGKSLKARGFTVKEGPPPFGPIGSHSATGYHYKMGETGVRGMALDINYGSGAREKAKLDPLADELVGNGWWVYWWTTGHYDHLHVDTRPGGRGKL